MRYFGGYNEEEVAEALGITTRTVQRDWQKARVLVARHAVRHRVTRAPRSISNGQTSLPP